MSSIAYIKQPERGRIVTRRQLQVESAVRSEGGELVVNAIRGSAEVFALIAGGKIDGMSAHVKFGAIDLLLTTADAVALAQALVIHLGIVVDVDAGVPVSEACHRAQLVADHPEVLERDAARIMRGELPEANEAHR